MAPDENQNVLRNTWRLDALDEWRKEVERRLAVIESEVHTIEETRKLNEALARNAKSAADNITAIRDKQGQLRLTRMQTLGGAIVGGVALAGFILQAVHG